MKVTRVLLFLGVATLASASSVTFNFNSLAENATTSQIQSYMNGVLTAAGCTGCSVTVTGAFADTTYNGDKHVTGPGSAGSGGTAAKSLTLGTSDGATASNTTSSINSSYDTFLATTNDAATSTDSQITIKFTGFTLNGAASFDYQIFPDASCTQLTTAKCGALSNGIYANQPDFKFDTNVNVPVASFGTNGVQYGVTPGTTNGNTNNSGLSSSELSPQYIGTWAGTLTNATEVDFIDWPATIGVDNLMVSWTPPGGGGAVPEPVSVVLFGTVVAGLALRKKFRKPAQTI